MFESRNKLAVIQSDRVKRILVFGDIHGDLFSLEKGLRHWKPGDLLLFLGDYADRGPNGVEVIERILQLKEKYPERVLPLKGNHEDYSVDGKPLFAPCTLIQEASHRRGSWAVFFKTLYAFITRLHLSAIIPGQILFVHGGIGNQIDSIDDLVNPERALIDEILWSDPGKDDGLRPNFRGIASVFGPDISEKVLSRLALRYVVRSHQPRKAMGGPSVEHNGKVITLSSTAVYGGVPFILILNMDKLPEDEKDFRECTVFLD